MSYDDYLKHHGIPGMRWGRRNGPPYPLLRRSMSSAERRENPTSSSDSQEGSKKVSTPKTVQVETETGTKTVSNSKPINQMSDKELDQTINRMKKEKEYRQLSAQDITKGNAWVKGFLGVTGAAFLSTLAVKIGTGGANDLYPKGKEAVTKFIDFLKSKKKVETNE